MNKKALRAAAIIMGLLISLVGASALHLARANPFVHNPIPAPPNSNGPVITVFSPKDHEMYSTSTLPFSFNISEPKPEVEGFKMSVKEVHYSTNWQAQNVSLPIQDPDSNNFSYSGLLSDIPPAGNTVMVTATGYFYNWTGMMVNYFYLTSTVSIYFSTPLPPFNNATPTPTLSPSPTQQPTFPTLPPLNDSTPTPPSSLTPSPSVAEFPIWTTLPIVLAAFAVGVASFFGRRYAKKFRT